MDLSAPVSVLECDRFQLADGDGLSAWSIKYRDGRVFNLPSDETLTFLFRGCFKKKPLALVEARLGIGGRRSDSSFVIAMPMGFSVAQRKRFMDCLGEHIEKSFQA